MKVAKEQNKVQPYRRLDVGRRGQDSQNTASKSSMKPTSSANINSLFDPKLEKAACGVGFIVNINGIASRKVSFNGSNKLIAQACRLEKVSLTNFNIYNI